MSASGVTCRLMLFNKLLRRVYFQRGVAFTNTRPFGPCHGGCVLYRNHSQWHLVGALCLERKPVVSQELTSMERQFKEYLDEVEVECSHLSDHELRLSKDLKTAAEVNEGEKQDLEDAFKNTAQDDEDAYNKELHQFSLAPRTADPEEENNRKNLGRHLSKSLVLLVKQKLGKDSHWGLPQAVRQEGETMQQVAERVCREVCGDGMNAVFLGKAPIGFCKYKYPKAARQDDVLGAKVFFFKAWHLRGNVCEETVKRHPEVEDYMWATRSELVQGLSQKDYRKTIMNFLVDEDNVMNENLQDVGNSEELQVEDSDVEGPDVKLKAQN